MSFDYITNKVEIEAEGTWDDDYTEEYTCPVKDLTCQDAPYVVYPNRLSMEILKNGYRSLVVNVTNHSQVCTEFRWQKLVLNRNKKVSDK